MKCIIERFYLIPRTMPLAKPKCNRQFTSEYWLKGAYLKWLKVANVANNKQINRIGARDLCMLTKIEQVRFKFNHKGEQQQPISTNDFIHK